MNITEKITQLKNIINENLLPIIGKKCILLDAPYHINTGDLLIWKGTISFLEDNGINLIYTRSCDTFNFESISPDVTILLNGGGNFGDLWRYFQEFKLKIVSTYPNNRIIFLPQSVEYKDLSIAEKDSLIFSKHKDLFIFVRDTTSKEFINKYFSNKCILLPDMAFCINTNEIRNIAAKYHIPENRILLVKRSDKESSSFDIKKYVSGNLESHDWPSFESMPSCYKKILKLRRLESIASRYICKHIAKYIQRIEDYYMSNICAPNIIKSGIMFLAPYNKIYTTRLHVAILSILLNKNDVVMIDNSYGKNKRFYEEWLYDLNTVKFIDKF